MQIILDNILINYLLTVVFHLQGKRQLTIVITNMVSYQEIVMDFFHTKRELLYYQYCKLKKALENSVLKNLLTKHEQLRSCYQSVKRFFFACFFRFLLYYQQIRCLKSLIFCRGTLSIRSPNHLFIY